MPEALLDHAVGLAHQADEEHHVDQRRVVGDDHLPRAAELFGALDLIGEHAAGGHEADEAPEQPTDGVPGALAMACGIAGQTGQQREDQQAQAQAADAEQQEADGGGEQAPVIGVTRSAYGLRCQFHVRLFQVWVQVRWPVSRQRNQLKAWGSVTAATAVLPPRSSCQSSPGVSNRPRA
ncbi:hypothetical protein D9M71_631950 [compost metagenome]